MVLRGHHMLCLLGFRGLGYNEEFVRRMSWVKEHLSSAPQVAVEVTDAPDYVCLACPYLGVDGCQLQDADSERRTGEQDRAVMARLGVVRGDSLPWSEVLSRIRLAVASGDLDGLCPDCPWLALGYCKQGLDQLRETDDQR